MPDLGKYAIEVLSAYGVSLGLIAALIAVTLRQGAKARRDLAEIEARKEKAGG